MGTTAGFRRGILVVALAGVGVMGSQPAASTAMGRPEVDAIRTVTSFPCRWNWDLQVGLRPGFVTASSSADCAGHRGSLTLRVRLLRLDPTTKIWATDRLQTRTWRDLRGSHFVAVRSPCAVSTVRAVFGWTLRNTRGKVVNRQTVRSGTLGDPGPGCHQVLVGPGTAPT